MPRYRVSGVMTISISTLIEASTEKEAVEFAAEQPVMSLCHQCASGEDTKEWVTMGELDGEPDELVAEEE